MATKKVNTTTAKPFDFGIFSNEKKKSEVAYVSIDKQGRIYMNADAQKLFGIGKGNPVDLQIGYKDGVIYMIKTDSASASETAKPFRFSGERAYASAKTLIEGLGISPKGDKKSEKYLFDENFKDFEGVFAFNHKVEEDDVAEGQTSIDDILEDAAAEASATTETATKNKKETAKA